MYPPLPRPAARLGGKRPGHPAGIRANLIAFEQTGTLYDGDTEAAERALAAAAELISVSSDPEERAAVDYFRTLCAQQRGQLGAALERAQAGLALVNPERAAPITAILQMDHAICLAGLGRSGEALTALGPPMGVDDSVGLAQVTIRCQCLRAAFLDQIAGVGRGLLAVSPVRLPRPPATSRTPDRRCWMR